ncbi:hypothetical protein L249_3687 [Ophiocordyceps polyrhachis-furcata BCC 54312]|uniref:Uncharacterized protein n=1 Tax=Ophiocordyceps polyrhachis-furcata BCC 54312 TaxID=1330021 RepID=A0A367L4P6_9HYPO|nr:hypothetical protein L249_3687 [Ophiocordyceps polyrhachis-furcata BCC 54312]
MLVRRDVEEKKEKKKRRSVVSTASTDRRKERKERRRREGESTMMRDDDGRQRRSSSVLHSDTTTERSYNQRVSKKKKKKKKNLTKEREGQQAKDDFVLLVRDRERERELIGGLRVGFLCDLQRRLRRGEQGASSVYAVKMQSGSPHPSDNSPRVSNEMVMKGGATCLWGVSSEKSP